MGKANNPHEGVQYRGDYSGAPRSVKTPSPTTKVRVSAGQGYPRYQQNRAVNKVKETPGPMQAVGDFISLGATHLGRRLDTYTSKPEYVSRDSVEVVVGNEPGGKSLMNKRARKNARNPHE